MSAANLKIQVKKLQAQALELYETDQKSALSLGMALFQVREAMEEQARGSFTRWFIKHGLNENRVYYCLRLVTKSEKEPEPIAPPAELPGVYRVLYADPPWEYGGAPSAMNGGAKAHYDTMPTEDLCELPLPKVADDAVLFLWTTSSMLPAALEVLKAWGFSYKTSFVWDKVKHNMGRYNSVRHEFLLLATKGSCLPENNKLLDSVVSIPRGRHSEKPKEFRELIDTLYPHGQRVELFARGTLPEGWQGWGNEYNGAGNAELERKVA